MSIEGNDTSNLAVEIKEKPQNSPNTGSQPVTGTSTTKSHTDVGTVDKDSKHSGTPEAIASTRGPKDADASQPSIKPEAKAVRTKPGPVKFSRWDSDSTPSAPQSPIDFTTVNPFATRKKATRQSPVFTQEQLDIPVFPPTPDTPKPPVEEKKKKKIESKKPAPPQTFAARSKPAPPQALTARSNLKAQESSQEVNEKKDDASPSNVKPENEKPRNEIKAAEVVQAPAAVSSIYVPAATSSVDSSGHNIRVVVEVNLCKKCHCK